MKFCPAAFRHCPGSSYRSRIKQLEMPCSSNVSQGSLRFFGTRIEELTRKDYLASNHLSPLLHRQMARAVLAHQLKNDSQSYIGPNAPRGGTHHRFDL